MFIASTSTAHGNGKKLVCPNTGKSLAYKMEKCWKRKRKQYLFHVAKKTKVHSYVYSGRIKEKFVYNEESSSWLQLTRPPTCQWLMVMHKALYRIRFVIVEIFQWIFKPFSCGFVNVFVALGNNIILWLKRQLSSEFLFQKVIADQEHALRFTGCDQ